MTPNYNSNGISFEEIYAMPFDVLSKNVDEGLVSWADISWAEDIMNPKPNVTYDSVYDPLEAFEEEVLENWSVPDLTLRKGIWENFPVSLVPIVDGDGTDRYAVVWHRKNFDEWRGSRSESSSEYMDYDHWCEWRLRRSLEHYSHKYTVEEARDETMILVVAMVHAPKTDEVKEEPVTLAKFSDLPKLTRLNDIKNNFPVVWHETQSKLGKKLYAVELFGKKIKELSATAGYDVTEEISSRLMASLKASASWRVIRAESPREFCRIEMI
jgi:hypothetical protein